MLLSFVKQVKLTRIAFGKKIQNMWHSRHFVLNFHYNIANINSCLENGVKIIENEISKDGPLKNKKISITGSFEDLSRNQLINLIEKNSGKFVSTISKNIDFIIVGKNPGNKEIKAKKLKINCLDINSFREIIQN